MERPPLLLIQADAWLWSRRGWRGVPAARTPGAPPGVWRVTMRRGPLLRSHRLWVTVFSCPRIPPRALPAFCPHFSSGLGRPLPPPGLPSPGGWRLGQGQRRAASRALGPRSTGPGQKAPRAARPAAGGRGGAAPAVTAVPEAGLRQEGGKLCGGPLMSQQKATCLAVKLSLAGGEPFVHRRRRPRTPGPRGRPAEPRGCPAASRESLYIPRGP